MFEPVDESIHINERFVQSIINNIPDFRHTLAEILTDTGNEPCGRAKILYVCFSELRRDLRSFKAFFHSQSGGFHLPENFPSFF